MDSSGARHPARFLILRSAYGELPRQSSERLAGRVEGIPICGLTLQEPGSEAGRCLSLHDGFLKRPPGPNAAAA